MSAEGKHRPSGKAANPAGLWAGWEGARVGGSLSPPNSSLNASGQARHLQSLQNHAPFPERKAKCKSPSQTHICSSAARKVEKALISELGGRDKYISSTPGAEEENINSGITPAATEVSPSLAAIQKHPRFLCSPAAPASRCLRGKSGSLRAHGGVIAAGFAQQGRAGGGRDSPAEFHIQSRLPGVLGSPQRFPS